MFEYFFLKTAYYIESKNLRKYKEKILCIMYHSASNLKFFRDLNKWRCFYCAELKVLWRWRAMLFDKKIKLRVQIYIKFKYIVCISAKT